MKTIFNKKALVRNMFLTLVFAVCVAIAYFEFGHKYNFGHFVAYGLHVDAISEEVSIGIPGQKKMYKAELSKFSFWPVGLQGCDYVTDAFGRGTAYPYAVQRWDIASSSWQTIVQANEDSFCHPVPLSTINAKLMTKRLWPGMSVDVMEGEATGATEPFQKGDYARFVVFRGVGQDMESRKAAASEAFVIEDEVTKEGIRFKARN